MNSTLATIFSAPYRMLHEPRSIRDASDATNDASRRGAELVTKDASPGAAAISMTPSARLAAAARPRPREELRYHAASHDLDSDGRTRAFELAKSLRAVEAALDPDVSPPLFATTVRALLARLSG